MEHICCSNPNIFFCVHVQALVVWWLFIKAPVLMSVKIHTSDMLRIDPGTPHLSLWTDDPTSTKTAALVYYYHKLHCLCVMLPMCGSFTSQLVYTSKNPRLKIKFSVLGMSRGIGLWSHARLSSFLECVWTCATMISHQDINSATTQKGAVIFPPCIWSRTSRGSARVSAHSSRWAPRVASIARHCAVCKDKGGSSYLIVDHP